MPALKGPKHPKARPKVRRKKPGAPSAGEDAAPVKPCASQKKRLENKNQKEKGDGRRAVEENTSRNTPATTSSSSREIQEWQGLSHQRKEEWKRLCIKRGAHGRNFVIDTGCGCDLISKSSSQQVCGHPGRNSAQSFCWEHRGRTLLFGLPLGEPS